MIQLKPLQPEDIEKLKGQAVEDMKSYPDFETGLAWSGWYGDILVGAGGIRMYWEGVADSWLIISRNIPDEIKVKSILLFRAKLKELIEEHGLWRVQAFVRADFDKGQTLVKALGFEYEGTMRKFAPDGSDMMIYAKVI